MSVTVTIYLWWLWPYLAAGVVVYPLDAWLYQRTTNTDRSYWQILTGAGLGRSMLRRIAGAVLMVATWPFAIWEQL